jgi:adenosylcobinamide hydrolase
MKYFTREHTLFLRGDFVAASTGVGGGIGRVSTLFNHTVPKNFDHADPRKYMTLLAAEYGYSPEFYGLLTAVEMKSLCIFHYDFVTVFITAGVSNPNPEGPNTINMIVYSSQGLSEGALLETIITATEAKAHALREMGFSFTGTTTDAVIVAYEGQEIVHEYAGTFTELGRRVYRAVSYGVQEALKRHEGVIERNRPSMFIMSRYGGEHWVEWIPENCPYYPCHFEGQRCDFCYCPFYPCMDEELGDLVVSSSGGTVWSCQRCTLLHEPEVAEYLLEYPEASLKELKKLRKK